MTSDERELNRTQFLREVSDLADMLRAKGVTNFEGGGIKLEFGAPVDTTPHKEAAPAVDLDLCKCGHASYQHVNGLCIVGCTVETCAGPEQNAKD